MAFSFFANPTLTASPELNHDVIAIRTADTVRLTQMRDGQGLITCTRRQAHDSVAPGSA